VRKNKTTQLISITLLALVAVLFGGACSSKNESDANLPATSAPDLSNHPIYSNYDFGKDKSVIDIGTQPIGVSPGIIGEILKHDAVLRAALTKLGLELRIHHFLKGADSNFFLHRGDLEVVTGGDMPALTACANTDIVVATLIKKGFSSLVAREHMLMTDLKGKKIGYLFGSNAHFALLQSLKDIGLNESDVHLVPLDVPKMPGALDRGEIDAFSTVEPNTSLALAEYDDFVVIHRSLNSAYLYFARSFVDRNPEAARLIIASQIRSMGWMREAKDNILEASRWTIQSREYLTGKKSTINEHKYATLFKSELLDVSPVAALPAQDLEPGGTLFSEFLFLKDLGKVPAASEWKKVKACFDLSLIPEILEKAQSYQLQTYDFSWKTGEIEKDG